MSLRLMLIALIFGQTVYFQRTAAAVDRNSRSNPPAALRDLDSADNNIVDNECFYDGKYFALRANVKMGCNSCTCVSATAVGGDKDGVGDGDSAARWRCTDHDCAVTPDLLDRVNSLGLGWRAQKYDAFRGFSIKELGKHKLGTRRPPFYRSAGMFTVKSLPRPDLPVEFDARRQWPGWIHPPTDQGGCGASWAFSTASVASDRLAIQSRGAVNVMLSSQHLLSCIGRHRGQNGCHPNGIDRAWWFIRRIGIVDDYCYPYVSSYSPRPRKCLLPRSHYLLQAAKRCPFPGSPIRVYRAAPPYAVSPSESDIMNEIRDNGPVQALMEVKEDFYSYKSGVYRSAFKDEGSTSNEQHKKFLHSVKILGWGVDNSTGSEIKCWAQAISDTCSAFTELCDTVSVTDPIS